MGIFNRKEKARLIQEQQRHYNYHTIFPNKGTYERTTYYSDNKPYAQELVICLSSQDWSEFADQEFFREMFEYLRSRGIQKNADNHHTGADL